MHTDHADFFEDLGIGLTHVVSRLENFGMNQKIIMKILLCTFERDTNLRMMVSNF